MLHAAGWMGDGPVTDGWRERAGDTVPCTTASSKASYVLERLWERGTAGVIVIGDCVSVFGDVVIAAIGLTFSLLLVERWPGVPLRREATTAGTAVGGGDAGASTVI